MNRNMGHTEKQNKEQNNCKDLLYVAIIFNKVQ